MNRLTRDIYWEIHSNTIPNSHPIPTHSRVDKSKVMYFHNGILLQHENDWSTTTLIIWKILTNKWREKNKYKRVYMIWFHLYKIRKQAKLFYTGSFGGSSDWKGAWWGDFWGASIVSWPGAGCMGVFSLSK